MKSIGHMCQMQTASFEAHLVRQQHLPQCHQRSCRKRSARPATTSPDPAMAHPPDISKAVLDDPTLNKVPIGMKMGPAVYRYLLDHTREPEVLAQLRAETAQHERHYMQITPEQGAFLGLLVKLMGAKRALEVGVFTGYSAISMAMALPEDGLLTALDVDEDTMAVARKYFERAGVAHKVKTVLAPAVDTLQQLLKDQGPNSFDLAFIDADKSNYDKYYELLLQLVRPGGLILVDNVMWSGRLADPNNQEESTLALRALNDKLVQDTRITLSIVPVGDGVALCLKN